VDLATQGAALLIAWVFLLLVWRFNLTLTTWYRPSLVYFALGLMSLLFVGQVCSRLVTLGV